MPVHARILSLPWSINLSGLWDFLFQEQFGEQVHSFPLLYSPHKGRVLFSFKGVWFVPIYCRNLNSTKLLPHQSSNFCCKSSVPNSNYSFVDRRLVTHLLLVFLKLLASIKSRDLPQFKILSSQFHGFPHTHNLTIIILFCPCIVIFRMKYLKFLCF